MSQQRQLRCQLIRTLFAVGMEQCVDIRALGPLPEPVTLEQCKADPKLADMVLVNNSRLSVQPVTADEWAHVCRVGGWRD